MATLRHDSAGRSAGFVQIVFPIEVDSDGYPPYASERLWAIGVSENEYRIDSIPFFVNDLSSGDIVAVKQLAGALMFAHVVEFSRHSTLRVIVFEASAHKLGELTEKVEAMGCSWEALEKRWVAIDVPPGGDIQSLTSYLENGEGQGHWSFEESAIRPADD